jgi:riboflavin kinase/FMN adenylyltransferase
MTGTAIALGNFDGVHLGHRRILDALRLHALRHGLRPVALTFDPHPRHFFSPVSKPALLTPPREKEALIAALGSEPNIELVTLPFDASLAALTAEEFYRDILRNRLGGRAFFLGPDHRFGRGAQGDVALLRARVGENGGDAAADAVVEIKPVTCDGTSGPEGVSSSAIRALLESGRPEDLALATRMLGRPYSLAGLVEKGRERGRLLGFPTANLRLEDPRKILPAFGVYGGYAHFDIKGHPQRLPAVANIGLRPTFSEPTPAVEVHIPDWTGDLYGKFMEFEISSHLRPEMKFNGVEALKAQIAQDVETWKSLEKSGF